MSEDNNILTCARAQPYKESIFRALKQNLLIKPLLNKDQILSSLGLFDRETRFRVTRDIETEWSRQSETNSSNYTELNSEDLKNLGLSAHFHQNADEKLEVILGKADKYYNINASSIHLVDNPTPVLRFTTSDSTSMTVVNSETLSHPENKTNSVVAVDKKMKK